MLALQSERRDVIQQYAGTRPTKVIEGMLPGGTMEAVNGVPKRTDAMFPKGAAGNALYTASVRSVATSFTRQQRAGTTAVEHERYAVMFEEHLVHVGFDSHFRRLPGLEIGKNSSRRSEKPIAPILPS